MSERLSSTIAGSSSPRGSSGAKPSPRSHSGTTSGCRCERSCGWRFTASLVRSVGSRPRSPLRSGRSTRRGIDPTYKRVGRHRKQRLTQIISFFSRENTNSCESPHGCCASQQLFMPVFHYTTGRNHASLIFDGAKTSADHIDH